MRHVDMKRRQTTPWPWLAGLVMLGLVVWAVTSLLAAAPEEPAPVADAAEEELSPASLPMQVNPIGVSPVRDVSELAPLDEDDIGQRLRAQGEVLATGNGGFWMLALSQVIRVDSEQVVRKGQMVEVHGTLHAQDPRRTEQIAAEVLSRGAQTDGWHVVSSVKLVAEEPEPAASGDRDGEAS